MNKSINNKGFTLVELLAVMVILISISLVAVVGITSSLTKRENKEKEEQKELAVNAAKIYFSLNSGTTCVKIQALIDNKYINNDNKIDTLNVNYYIKLKNSNKYEYQSNCSG